MAISSSSTHRSLSPVSRNPQGSNGGPRRSFNGNPLVRSATTLNNGNPVGSPSDSSRKSLNKEGFVEFKENEKKAKQSCSIQRGTKGFMAPTISAISKKSPSPSVRKKVLSERNETVGSSIHEGGEIGFDFKATTHNNPSFKPRALDYETVEADSVDITEPISTTPLKFSQDTAALVLPEPKTIPIGSAEKKTNPPPSSPYQPVSIGSPPYAAIAPLDSDPHLPPYDPKTNYLSPRPRFLHYKPRPRVEVYVQNEKGVDFVEEGKKLEESFSSASCSDTETTDEVPSSGSSWKEEGSGSEDDYLSSEFVSEEENQTFVSEPKLDYTQMKKTPSSCRSFLDRSRLRIAPFLLVFVIACLSFQVIDTPRLPQSTYQVQSLSMDDATAKLAESVKVNFRDFKLWSSNTISYLSMFMSIPRAAEDLGPLHFSNTTLISEECCFKQIVNVDSDQIDEMEMGRDAQVVITQEEEPERYIEVINEPLPPPTQEIHGESEIENQENLDLHIISEPPVDTHVTSQSSDLDNPIPSQSAELGVTTESQSININIIPQNSELDDSVLTQTPNSSGFLSENMELDDSVPTQSSNSEWDDSVLTQSPSSDFHSESQEMDDGSQFPELVSSGDVDGVETLDKTIGSLFSVQTIGIMLSSVVTVAAAATTTYVYLERKKAAVSKKMVSKKPSASSIGDSGEHRFFSPPKSSHLVMVDDSCCSEVSSSFKRSSPHGLDDTQSGGKRQRYHHPKREVLPSSSEYSYGSFTTYEKIHSKYGCGEEEVVTPVRRSSRIRNIISP